VQFIAMGYLLMLGQIFHNIPTWLKWNITTKYQAEKVNILEFEGFFFAFFSKNSNISARNPKKQSWYINCYMPKMNMEMKTHDER
jgi:hypothetical protein